MELEVIVSDTSLGFTSFFDCSDVSVCQKTEERSDDDDDDSSGGGGGLTSTGSSNPNGSSSSKLSLRIFVQKAQDYPSC